MLDRVSTPDNNLDPAPDARSYKKISVCSVIEQLVSRAVDTQTLLTASTFLVSKNTPKWEFNSLLSVKKLTEKSQRKAEAGDEVMMVKRNRVYWTIVAYVSMIRLRLMSTNTTCTVIPKLLQSNIPLTLSFHKHPRYLSLLIQTKKFMKPHKHEIEQQWKCISKDKWIRNIKYKNVINE